MTNNSSPNSRYVIPELGEFLSRRMRDVSASINCCMVGTIQSFNSTNQTVVVLINWQKRIKLINPTLNTNGAVNKTAGGTDQIQAYPMLINVPVVFLQGGVSYLTFPIVKGDTCLVMFCDRDMDTWFNTYVQTFNTDGSLANLNPPNSDRVHDINDAIAMVGIRNLKNSLSNYNTLIPSLTDMTGERLTQAGFLQPYAGSTAPSGWLLCYGQAVSRTLYPILFTVIGTTYGSGDGSTTFNVPDLRGRTVAGLDNMGGTDANRLTTTYTPNRNTLGGGAGEEAHTLVVAELPPHDHTMHGQGAIASAGYLCKNNSSYSGGGGSNFGVQGSPDTTMRTDFGLGTSTPHNTVQPTLMTNWLIKC